MDNKHPRFSVIIPTRNRIGYLCSCLRALGEMEYPRDGFEVIVVDDGSAQPVRERAKEAGGGLEVQWIRLEENRGAAVARNQGAARARGRYLAFLDDDCLASREWLAKLDQTLEGTPRSAVGGRVVNGRPQNVYAQVNQAILDEVYRYYNAEPDNSRFFATMNFAVPAELFRELGGFNPSFRVSEDREFCARWRARGLRLVYAAGALVTHDAVLGGREFWLRHYRFGQGAYHFRKTPATPASNHMRLEPAGFYRRLVTASLQAGYSLNAVLAAVLAGISQLASALGFWAAGLRTWLSGKEPAASGTRPGARVEQ